MYLFKNEMHVLILLGMHIGMPEPYMGSWQCMYQGNFYIDTSMAFLCLCLCYIKTQMDFITMIILYK